MKRLLLSNAFGGRRRCTQTANRYLASNFANFTASRTTFSSVVTESSDDLGGSDGAHIAVVDNGSRIDLRFRGDETPTSFHASFLWSNDPTFLHPTSGQRMRSLTAFFGHRVVSAEVITKFSGETPPPPPGCLHSTGSVYQTVTSTRDDDVDADRTVLQLEWENEMEDTYTACYDMEWLRSRRYDEAALGERYRSTEVSPSAALSQDSGIAEISYSALQSDEEPTLFQILDTLFRDGAVLLKGATPVPDDLESTVGALGRSLAGRLSHGHLYGDIFHVQHIKDAHNIAYTTGALPPHQDLAYFTTKPGLQLLHCVNTAGTIGGESILIDGLAAATEFSRLAPDLYQVLLDCEATFLKQRGDADMAYRRPHIQEDSTGAVVAVHWSPPFEGPLSLDASKVDDYFVAYTAFERMVNDSLPQDRFLLPIATELESQLMEYARTFTFQKPLQHGDILVFNNHRMLHGRREFSVQEKPRTNGRHLVGCYTDLDETLNQYRLLRRNYLTDKGSSTYIRNSGNGSSSIF